MLFSIKDKEAKGQKLKDGYLKPSEEILITRLDIEDIKNQKDKLKQEKMDLNQDTISIKIVDKKELINQLEIKKS